MAETQDVNPKTIKLGGSLQVCRMGFGTIYLTAQRSFGLRLPNSKELLQEAVRLGVNFFVTADSYGPREAEDAIREALHPYEGLVISTKGGYSLNRESSDDWKENGSREHLLKAFDESLERLERIDLYQLHTPDQEVPYEHSLGGLKDLCDKGKIQFVGVSRVNWEQLRKAQGILGDRLVAIENCYNVFYPQGYTGDDERDNVNILAECERKGLAFIAYEPLAPEFVKQGVLNDVVLQKFPERRKSVQKKLELLQEVTKNYSVEKQPATIEQVMLAALLQKSEVIIPIPGTSKVHHLRQNVAAMELELEDNDLELLWSVA